MLGNSKKRITSVEFIIDVSFVFQVLSPSGLREAVLANSKAIYEILLLSADKWPIRKWDNFPMTQGPLGQSYALVTTNKGGGDTMGFFMFLG